MMKNIALILIFLLLGHIPVRSQSFLAGIWGVNDFYTDVQPDTVLQINHDMNPNSESYPIDINGDQSIDFLFQVEDLGVNQWYGGYTCVLIPFGNNQIARGRIDSCFSDSFANQSHDFIYSVNMAKSFSYQAVLQNHQDWIDSAAYLLYSRHDVNNNYPIGFEINTNTFGAGQTYLGVRLPMGNDTLYGWIGVYGDTASAQSGPYIIAYKITNYAISWGLTGITPSASVAQLQVMPNPANDVLQFCLNASIPEATTLIVYDLAGSEVESCTIPAGTKNYNLITSQWSSGMYFFRYQNQTGKFLITH
jgi:hypothetical protein